MAVCLCLLVTHFIQTLCLNNSLLPIDYICYPCFPHFSQTGSITRPFQLFALLFLLAHLSANIFDFIYSTTANNTLIHPSPQLFSMRGSHSLSTSHCTVNFWKDIDAGRYLYQSSVSLGVRLLVIFMLSQYAG